MYDLEDNYTHIVIDPEICIDHLQTLNPSLIYIRMASSSDKLGFPQWYVNNTKSKIPLFSFAVTCMLQEFHGYFNQ